MASSPEGPAEAEGRLSRFWCFHFVVLRLQALLRAGLSVILERDVHVSAIRQSPPSTPKKYLLIVRCVYLKIDVK